jgi:hypothetical protein
MACFPSGEEIENPSFDMQECNEYAVVNINIRIQETILCAGN